VLLIEDNFLIAEHLRGALENHGCAVVGPAPHVKLGLALVEAGLDGAILDINLNGEFCFPIAEALAGLNVPFLFLTGYDDRAIIPPEFRAVPFLSKPVEEARLVAAVAAFGSTRNGRS
jgi:DNA-binding LytR/AlgR family response regulator